MIHGWPLLTAALTAGVLLWGRVGHHVKREASRFIPSTLYALLYVHEGKVTERAGRISRIMCDVAPTKVTTNLWGKLKPDPKNLHPLVAMLPK